MSDTIGWGILGAGRIARLFAHGLEDAPDARLVAVASRTPDRLKQLGETFGGVQLHREYTALVEDPAVDIVYVATTNQLHRELSLLALRAHKPVVCEKPFTMDAAEAREVIALARREGVFCMEAMWMRFLPLVRALPELLTSGGLGEVRMLRADFGEWNPYSPEHRLFEPALGGGALLDLGVYPLSLAFYLLGRPRAVASRASLAPTGVDAQSAAVLEYPNGRLAFIACSIVARLPTDALIVGERGHIRIHAPLYRPSEYSVAYHGEGGTEHRQGTVSVPFQGNGYNYEAVEAMRCLRAGERESPVMPLDETLAIMETMDAIRACWGHGAAGRAGAGEAQPPAGGGS